MVPNSVPFIFLFLPAALVAYFTAKRVAGIRVALGVLLLASFIFYAWAKPALLLILVGSMTFNFVISRQAHRKAFFWMGIAGNLGLLGYFKYTNFFFSTLNQVLGSTLFPPYAIILPIGISFFTFTQIAYLIDTANDQARHYDWLHYMLFVSFFPYVLSGPIVKHDEIIPQFSAASTAIFHWEDFSLGLTLFFIGLFKKVILADGVSDFAIPVFTATAHGTAFTFFEAWFGALAYTAQLYFDFSGYTDMAIGAARMFGIRLPLNFNSPYKAVNVIDFWNRWHMTLTRFLTNYIYNPTVLAIVRARIHRRKPVIQKGKGTIGAFLAIVAFPMLLTMFISGLWHGAGWTFIVFGMLHGCYLVINHAWNMWKKFRGYKLENGTPLGRTLGRVLTFVGVVVTFVFFRSENVPAACRLLKGMFFGNGISLSQSLPAHWPHAASILAAHHIAFKGLTYTPIIGTLTWIFSLYALIWACPNSQEWLSRFEPSGRWAVAMGLITVIALWAVIGISRPIGFLYFKF